MHRTVKDTSRRTGPDAPVEPTRKSKHHSYDAMAEITAQTTNRSPRICLGTLTIDPALAVQGDTLKKYAGLRDGAHNEKRTPKATRDKQRKTRPQTEQTPGEPKTPTKEHADANQHKGTPRKKTQQPLPKKVFP